MSSMNRNTAKKEINSPHSVLVHGVSLGYKENASEALEMAGKKLQKAGIRTEHVHIYKRSVDARDKSDIRFVYSVLAECTRLPDERRLERVGATLLKNSLEEPEPGNKPLMGRAVVVGFGPGGMFTALTLARKGYRPLIIERGEPVKERKASVDLFLKTGRLNENSNIQFGAGGAGTFSDGKLVTRVNDPLSGVVLDTLHSFGAPESILTQAKPHVGTDRLCLVVENIEKEIRRLGGEFLYNTVFQSAKTDSNGRVYAVQTDKGSFPCGVLVLAIGHSARDTYQQLIFENYSLAAKDFSVGARVEHLQESIDRALYGEADISILGHGEYTLSYREGDRGVYSFCMCPGGQVICASSQEGGLVVNGMSNYARDGRNANSAIAVSVLKEDYGATPMEAIRYQEKIEQNAFVAGGGDYSAPIQTLGDFLSVKRGTAPTVVEPTFRDGKHTRLSDLSAILPPKTVAMMRKGFPLFEKRIAGFSAPFALLTGVETRTSAPVRILRNEDMTAIGHENIYPCGEGAGYAGGITSAAIDGMRTAYRIIERYKPTD